MRRISTLAAACTTASLIFTLSLAGPAFADDMTTEDIIAKSVEKLGGLAAWDAVQSAQYQATLAMGGGMELPMTFFFKKPGMMRGESDLQGQKVVQAYDGSQGWQVMPMGGKLEPQLMSKGEATIVRVQSDFEGPLVNYKKKGHTVELIGKETVEGTESYRLKVTTQADDVIHLFVDTKSFLPHTMKVRMMIPTGQEIDTNISIGDYQEVAGVLIPHSMSILPEGMPQGMDLTYSDIEINPELDDSLFMLPPQTSPAPATSNR